MEIDDFKNQRPALQKYQQINPTAIKRKIKPPLSTIILSFLTWILFILVGLPLVAQVFASNLSPIFKIVGFCGSIILALSATIILFCFIDLVKSVHYLAKKEGME